MKKFSIVLLIVFSCFILSCQMTKKAGGVGNGKLEDISADTFTTKVKSEDSGTVVFMGYKTGCGNCTSVRASLESIASEEDYSTIKFYESYMFTGNAAADPSTKTEFLQDGRDIKIIEGSSFTTPVVIVYVNGEAKKGFTGYKTTDDIKNLINSYK